jgi:hypothetical protein
VPETSAEGVAALQPSRRDPAASGAVQVQRLVGDPPSGPRPANAVPTVQSAQPVQRRQPDDASGPSTAQAPIAIRSGAATGAAAAVGFRHMFGQVAPPAPDQHSASTPSGTHARVADGGGALPEPPEGNAIVVARSTDPGSRTQRSRFRTTIGADHESAADTPSQSLYSGDSSAHPGPRPPVGAAPVVARSAVGRDQSVTPAPTARRTAGQPHVLSAVPAPPTGTTGRDTTMRSVSVGSPDPAVQRAAAGERPAGAAAVGYAPAPQTQVDLFVLHRSETTAPPAVQRALTPDRPALVAPILADRAPPAGPGPISSSEPRSASAGPSTRTGSTDSRRREAAVQRSGLGGPVGGLRKPAPVQRRSTGAGLLPAGAVAVAAACRVTSSAAPVRTASVPPNVQRANPAPAPPAPPDSAAPSVIGAPADTSRDWASRPSGSAPAVLDAKALDQLAGRLYDPLLSRLRAELWSDRERAGLLADTW